MLHIAKYLNRVVLLAAALFRRKKTRQDFVTQVALLTKARTDLVLARLEPWYAFNRKGIETKDHQGNPVAFFGVGYKGRPRTFFWNEIVEPTLKGHLEALLKDIEDLSRRWQIKAESHQQFIEILRAAIREWLAESRRIDQILRESTGKGAQRVKPHNTDHLEEALITLILKRFG